MILKRKNKIPEELKQAFDNALYYKEQLNYQEIGEAVVLDSEADWMQNLNSTSKFIVDDIISSYRKLEEELEEKIRILQTQVDYIFNVKNDCEYNIGYSTYSSNKVQEADSIAKETWGDILNIRGKISKYQADYYDEQSAAEGRMSISEVSGKRFNRH